MLYIQMLCTPFASMYKANQNNLFNMFVDYCNIYIIYICITVFLAQLISYVIQISIAFE